MVMNDINRGSSHQMQRIEPAILQFNREDYPEDIRRRELSASVLVSVCAIERVSCRRTVAIHR